MGEAGSVEDVDMNNSEAGFDNLVILKELDNIANLVRNEDLVETLPKAKLKRVKWVPMFNCLKQGILDAMVQELNSMWKYENMPRKLDALEKQREKFADVNQETQLWRPQLNDVKAQLRAHDVANLQKQKIFLESLAKDYEVRVLQLKKTLLAKRGYFKAAQMDIHKYQKKTNNFMNEMEEKFKNHNQIVKMILPKNIDVEEIKWSLDSEFNEKN